MHFLPSWLRPWVLPVCVLALWGLALEPILAGEAKSWLHALDLGGRTILASLIFTVVGIVVVYIFIGRGWRDFFACLFCLAFVLFQSPEIISEPAKELTKRYNNVAKLHPDDSTMAILFFAVLAFFFAVKTIFAVLEMMNEDEV